MTDHYSHSQFDVDEDGNSVIASVINPEVFECQVDVCQPMVLERLTDAGDRVWQRTYDEGEDFRVSFTPDDNIAVASRNPMTNPDSTWVALLDDMGNEIWSQTYVGADLTAPHAIAAGPDGQVWVAGRTYQAPHWLRRYDATGSLISHVDLTPWSESVNALTVAQDGTYYVGGSVYDETDQSIGARLTHFGTADEPLWQYRDVKEAMPFERQVLDLAVTRFDHSLDRRVLGDAGRLRRRGQVSMHQ